MVWISILRDENCIIDSDIPQPDYLQAVHPHVTCHDEYSRDFCYDDGGETYDWSSKYPVIDCACSVFDNLYEQKEGGLEIPDVDLSTMNHEQKLAFNMIMDTVLHAKEGTVSHLPLVVAGQAGSGKSYLINCLVNAIRRVYNSNSSVRVLAPTGSAASLINGATTIHKLLKIPTAGRQVKGDMIVPVGEKGQFLQTALRETKCLLIDERSLVGCRVLGWMEHHVKHGKMSEEAWGGMPAIVFLGDDVQLPPVLDSPVFF